MPARHADGAITWIGVPRPADGVDYVISYNDCCGRDFCSLLQSQRGRQARVHHAARERHQLVSRRRQLGVQLLDRDCDRNRNRGLSDWTSAQVS
jgi:hypothetical protein